MYLSNLSLRCHKHTSRTRSDVRSERQLYRVHPSFLFHYILGRDEMIISNCPDSTALSRTAIRLATASTRSKITEKTAVTVQQTIEQILRKLFRHRMIQSTFNGVAKFILKSEIYTSIYIFTLIFDREMKFLKIKKKKQ